MDSNAHAETDRRFACLEGAAEPEPEIALERGMKFSTGDRLAFLQASEGLRCAALKPGLSSAGRLALRFLAQQTRRLARAPR